MHILDTALPDVKVIEPAVFRDSRGFFLESFNQVRFEAAMGHPVRFVQDNHSRSVRGVLRGLHYQMPPRAQGKLVRVVTGAIFDVAVDVRRTSATCGQWVGAVLSAENKKQIWIPAGFAHGFVTLSETADVLYKTTDYYAAPLERYIIWNDPDLAIDWPDIEAPTLSQKDQSAGSFKAADLFEV